MKALLHSKGLWHLVDGKEKCPTTGDKEQESWDIKQDKAVGELMLNLMPDQQVHIQALQDDPTAALNALAMLFVQQKASTCFIAYEEFFSIRKCSDKSLLALSARVELAMARIQELHPTSFNLKTLDAELSCMAMMHALKPKYSHFTSSLAPAIVHVAAQDMLERAGNASFHSRDPSNPLSPLQLDADTDWNSATGATFHMTPLLELVISHS